MRETGAAQGPERTDFSVVIPTYNRASHIGPCLAPFLEPEAAGIEVILVDDGSSDDTPAVAEAVIARSRGADIRFVRQANGGPGKARNTGIAQATRDWVVFLDVDDRWFPWTIRNFRTVLAEVGDGAAMMFSRAALFEADSELAAVSEEPLEWRLLDGFLDFTGQPDLRAMRVWGSCNAALRRDLVVAVGGFDERIRCSEDVDLFFRLSASGRTVMVRHPAMLGYRVDGSDSLSRNNERMIEGMNFILQHLQTGRYPNEPLALGAVSELYRLRKVRTFFSVGQVPDAYRLLLADPGFLIRQWGLVTWTKTVLTPVLHWVRPKNYQLDWKAWLRPERR